MAKDGFGFGDILKWGLVLGGGYYLYEMFFGPASAAPGQVSVSDLANAAGLPPAAVTPVTQPPAPPPSQNQTKQLILQAAQAGGYPASSLLTHFQWNYFYTKARGVNMPPIKWPASYPDAYKMTFDEWWGVVSAQGLAGGLGGVRLSLPLLVNVPGGRPVLAWASENSSGDRPLRRGGDGVFDLPPSRYRRIG